MKSLVLATVSAAALLVANGAFAQATQTMSGQSSSIDQIGDRDTANVTQSVDARSNPDTSVVIQGGSQFAATSHDNLATVTQDQGKGNASLVMQATTNNTTDVYGNHPNAPGNVASVHQTGSNGVAFGYQFGSHNTATLNQSGQGGDNSSNFIAGVQGSAQTQDGINLAVQFRNRNVDTVQRDTTADFGGNSGHEAAVIVQDWAVNNGATIDQAGKNNRAVAVQAYQTDSKATINQASSSSDNNAFAQQEGDASGFTGSFDTASINQYGMHSTATISQIGATNDSASSTQEAGSAGNNSYTYQHGDSQLSTIDQGGAGYNTATVAQSGQYDASDITQMGRNNQATVTQALASSWSHVDQEGNRNNATVDQYAGTAPMYAMVRQGR